MSEKRKDLIFYFAMFFQMTQSVTLSVWLQHNSSWKMSPLWKYKNTLLNMFKHLIVCINLNVQKRMAFQLIKIKHRRNTYLHVNLLPRVWFYSKICFFSFKYLYSHAAKYIGKEKNNKTRLFTIYTDMRVTG